MKAKASFAIAALLGLALQGCAEKGNHYNVVLSPAFSAEQQENVISGVELWVLATQDSAHPLSITYKIADNTCSDMYGLLGGGDWHTVCFIPATEKNDMQLGSSKGNLGLTLYTAATDSSTIRIAVDNPNLNPKSVDYTANMQEVCAHEFGHALGLVHHTGKVLMNPDLPNAASSPTSDDLKQFEGTF